MEIVPIFAGLLGTGYLIDRQLRTQKEALDAPISENISTVNNQTIPTIPQYTVNRDVIKTNVEEPLEIQDQYFRSREDALHHNVPALPSGNRPFLPTLRKHYWMPPHETVDYREPEIGNVKWTTKMTDVRVEDILRRYEPDRKDFRDANGQIVQSHSTGVDRILRASEREGDELVQLVRKKWLDKYNPNVIRTTQINGRQMTPSKMVFGSKELPSFSTGGMAWDTQRKNIQVTRFPQISSQVQHNSFGNRAHFSEMRLGKDKTVQGRTPMIKGIGKPTRPYIADYGDQEKEDNVLPGRQPGVHSGGTYHAPYHGHGIELSQTKKKTDELYVPPFGIPRVQSSWVRRSSNRHEENTSAVDRSMEYPQTRIIEQPVSQGMAPPGVNTRSGKTAPPVGYHPVLVPYFSDRSLKTFNRGSTVANFGPSQGLHPTTNLSHEQSVAVRAC